MLRRNLASAAGVLGAACEQFPDNDELCLALAGVYWQLRERVRADALLEALLAREPGHVAAALTLARLRIELGNGGGAEAVLQRAFEYVQPPDLVLHAARLLAGAGRKRGAANLCEAAIAAGSDDPFLRVYVAALHGQLGAFERARAHYVHALESDLQTVDAGAAYGLASIKRYADPADPDLSRFNALLERPGLAPAARASVLFALGKAHDDLGAYAMAAAELRSANGLVDHHGWTRKHWRRMVSAKLAAGPLPSRTPEADECIPVFIVGAPRSGTTLVAELLGRSPQVRNRGELDALPDYADELANMGDPDSASRERVAGAYLAQLQQGAAGARWYVDKQPLNCLHIGLIRALFPQARIVCCRRSPRDTALSIWSQHFASPDYRFAYDLADIAAVLDGCERLLDKARADGPVLDVRYEDLARDPNAVVGDLAARLGLEPFDCGVPAADNNAIGTASVWQARQPVYTRSIGRWRHYAAFVPELLRFADNDRA
ncbi:MAG TPA: sulfotransferase [Rhodanobacteraceae bacterium]